MILIAPPCKKTSDHAELRILAADPSLNGAHEGGRVLVIGTSADGGDGLGGNSTKRLIIVPPLIIKMMGRRSR